jgi:tight adherence protein B
VRRSVLSLLGAMALLAAVPLAAWGQAATPSAEIAEVNLGRFSDGGRVTMVVELRGLDTTADPAQLAVTENGAPVENLSVEPLASSTVPVGVVLAIDTSGSMAGEPLVQAQAAAKAFVSAKRSEDFVAIVSFADQAVVQSAFTTSVSTLEQRIDSLVAGGETALYDGIVKSVDLFGGSQSALRKNVIVLSDGADTVSTATEATATASAVDGDVRVFGVALQSADFDPGPLQRITQATDGLFLTTTNPQELTALYGAIQREISNTLVVRFNSSANVPAEVEFGVSYAGTLTASTAVDVPGYVATTTAPPSTTTTFAQAQPSVVEPTTTLSSSTLLLVAVVGVAAATFALLYILFGGNREEDPFTKRLERYGKRGPKEVNRPFIERIPGLRRFSTAAEEEVRRRGLLGPLNSALEQANLPLTAGEAVLAGIGLAGLAGLVTGLIYQNLILGAAVAIGSVFLVLALVQFTGSREKRRFENQLPDTLVLLATSLRAGYSLLQAIEAVANEAPDPTAREFSRALNEARLGIPVTQALQGITARTQSQDFKWAVIAIEIQREVGGNLAEVLQTVAETMRARNRLKGDVKALTAEGRISAIVVGGLPIFMAFFLFTTNPDYIEPLLTTTVGLVAIGVGLLLMIAGAFWLKKIVTVEV